MGYPLLGAALEASGRNIVYSCSWPDYEMDQRHSHGNISVVDWPPIINAGCNQFRVFDDINCRSSDLFAVIDHFGDYGFVMSAIHGPGKWMDADQLLVGAGCLSADEERTNMAMWAILAQPLFISADVRNMTDESVAILLNPRVVEIDQDPMGQMGLRVEPTAAAPLQRWSRRLVNGDVAVVLLNRHGAAPPCPAWDTNSSGYRECCGGCCVGFSNLTVSEAEAACCGLGLECAGFSISASAAQGAPADGCFKASLDCFQPSTGYIGVSRQDWPPPEPLPSDITLNFTAVGYGPNTSLTVQDVWSGEDLGVFADSFTAKNVPYHGSAFLRLTVATK